MQASSIAPNRDRNEAEKLFEAEIRSVLVDYHGGHSLPPNICIDGYIRNAPRLKSLEQLFATIESITSKRPRTEDRIVEAMTHSLQFKLDCYFWPESVDGTEQDIDFLCKHLGFSLQTSVHPSGVSIFLASDMHLKSIFQNPTFLATRLMKVVQLLEHGFEGRGKHIMRGMLDESSSLIAQALPLWTRQCTIQDANGEGEISRQVVNVIRLWCDRLVDFESEMHASSCCVKCGKHVEETFCSECGSEQPVVDGIYRRAISHQIARIVVADVLAKAQHDGTVLPNIDALNNLESVSRNIYIQELVLAVISTQVVGTMQSGECKGALIGTGGLIAQLQPTQSLHQGQGCFVIILTYELLAKGGFSTVENPTKQQQSDVLVGSRTTSSATALQQLQHADLWRLLLQQFDSTGLGEADSRNSSACTPKVLDALHNLQIVYADMVYAFHQLFGQVNSRVLTIKSIEELKNAFHLQELLGIWDQVYEHVHSESGQIIWDHSESGGSTIVGGNSTANLPSARFHWLNEHMRSKRKHLDELLVIASSLQQLACNNRWEQFCGKVHAIDSQWDSFTLETLDYVFNIGEVGSSLYPSNSSLNGVEPLPEVLCSNRAYVQWLATVVSSTFFRQLLCEEKGNQPAANQLFATTRRWIELHNQLTQRTISLGRMLELLSHIIHTSENNTAASLASELQLLAQTGAITNAPSAMTDPSAVQWAIIQPDQSQIAILVDEIIRFSRFAGMFQVASHETWITIKDTQTLHDFNSLCVAVRTLKNKSGGYSGLAPEFLGLQSEILQRMSPTRRSSVGL
jgi:hypothetical protein